jgi:hypothetical protein
LGVQAVQLAYSLQEETIADCINDVTEITFGFSTEVDMQRATTPYRQTTSRRVQMG